MDSKTKVSNLFGDNGERGHYCFHGGWASGFIGFKPQSLSNWACSRAQSPAKTNFTTTTFIGGWRDDFIRVINRRGRLLGRRIWPGESSWEAWIRRCSRWRPLGRTEKCWKRRILRKWGSAVGRRRWHWAGILGTLIVPWSHDFDSMVSLTLNLVIRRFKKSAVRMGESEMSRGSGWISGGRLRVL